nr:MAG TPA: hypothetical protein [Caudoviricetes sp.]
MSCSCGRYCLFTVSSSTTNCFSPPTWFFYSYMSS